MSPWLDLVEREYLSDFTLAGGGCVRFLCGSPQEAATISAPLDELAESHGYIRVDLDAERTKLQRIDAVFFEVARQIDWAKLAHAYVGEGFRSQGWLVEPTVFGFDVHQIAMDNQVDELEVRAALKAWLIALYDDFAMSHEFRLAMLQFCRAQVAGLDNCAPAVSQWLSGELRRLSEVKSAKVYQKVGRHNARLMLQSLTYWLRRNGQPGLVVTLDITRCVEVGKRAERKAGFYYSAAALTEVYEMLRQLIDSSSDMLGTFIVVFAPPAFLVDEKRGVDRYQALKMRIFDDARNRGTQNLLAPMVRLGELRLVEAA